MQKHLARAGVASRRKSEELILAGRVMVNGEVVSELGRRVDPGDVVFFDGQPVNPEPLEYFLLNKPSGVVSSVSDPHGRKTVVDLIAGKVRLFPVGRLDQDTTGLLIVTNDGFLAHRLMHPRFEVDKVYLAEVSGAVTEEDIERLRRGVELEDGLTAPAGVRLCGRPGRKTQVEIVIHEGRKRQVRRMMEAVGHPALHLHRKQYAMLSDQGLAVGVYRVLAKEEVKALYDLVTAGER